MTVEILIGDCREILRDLPPDSIHCCVTSPPYFGLRDYESEDQIGMEDSPEAFVSQMLSIFREVHRVLRPDGTFWLNLGDTYASAPGQATRGGPPSSSSTLEGNGHRGGGPKLASFARVGSSGNKGNDASDHGRRDAAPGLKLKDLIGIPWEVAFALRTDGWWLRSAIIWAKPNGMPSSQEDRPTSSYETLFMFSKSATYWSDFDAIKTPPRESTMIRTAQDLQAQAGSHRANEGRKTNGPDRAVGGMADKQRGHSRKHAGFNARWDAMDKIEQQGRAVMIRDVWFIPPANSSDPHFAQMPEELARRCILAGCPVGGTVLDPFGGAGTTGVAAQRHGRNGLLIELNPKYVAIAKRRLRSKLMAVSADVDVDLGLEPLPLFI